MDDARKAQPRARLWVICLSKWRVQQGSSKGAFVSGRVIGVEIAETGHANGEGRGERSGQRSKL